MAKANLKFPSFKSFLKDKRGSIKILTAVTAVPTLMMGGVAIDTAEMYRAKINFQAAVDSAALMAARNMSRSDESNDQARIQQSIEAGRAVFQANIANLKSSTGTISFNIDAGSCATTGIVATANLRHPLWFDKLHNVYSKNGDPGYTNMQASSTVTCGSTTVEISLVLDNSGSMRRNSKLTTLKAAATNLVNSLHSQMANTPPVGQAVKFSVVPFSALVNVGANNQNASWMDRTGINPIHWGSQDSDKRYFFNWEENDDVVKVANAYRTQSGTPISRFTLYDNISNVSWGGCVEALPAPYHQMDETPNVGVPSTMIVPSFAPDTPDDWSDQRERIYQDVVPVPYCVKWTGSKRCKKWSDGARGQRHPRTNVFANYYSYDYRYRGRWRYGNTGGGTQLVNGNVIDEDRYQNNYLKDDHNFKGALDARDPSTTGRVEDQYKRQAWTRKYFRDSSNQRPVARDINNNRSGIPNVISYPGGPNFACTAQPITDLTNNRQEVITALNNMVAVGLTNIQQGVVWGWRTLSQNPPFTEGRVYGDPGNRKIMIMMTDGNNTYFDIEKFYGNRYSKKNESYYGAWGHTVDRRIFEGFSGAANAEQRDKSFTDAMNESVRETCDNIKEKGIRIYSIAFDISEGSSAHSILQHCASADGNGAKQYYNAKDNASLVRAFDSIAEKIAELAISQ